VVLVTLAVASTLGWFAYAQFYAQTEMLMIDLAMQGQTSAFIEAQARQYDQRMAIAIVGGIVALAVALGLTGVLITHRVVGPAYKLKRLFQHVIDGHLRLDGRLRKGDELQDVFEVFERMVDSLRSRERAHVARVDALLEQARRDGSSDEIIQSLEALRADLQASLD
jgi:nitrogen fixation/metabolism regulation signal transduction histidine kinase